jgi:hypothetical protein
MANIEKKKRGWVAPLAPENALKVESGDNSNFIGTSLELFNLPDINLNDPEQLLERLNECFGIFARHDVKPTVAGIALALNGKDRRWLWSVANDKPYGSSMVNLNPQSVDLIKKVYRLLDNQWQHYMQEGKINPVSGIFLGKNNYGYVDKTETVVTPNTNLATTDAATIEAKYRELPGAEDQRLLDTEKSSD